MAFPTQNMELFELLTQNANTLGIEFVSKKMFAHHTLFVNDNMFAGTWEDRIFVRVGSPRREELINTEPGIGRFEPQPGRAMKEYIALDSSVYNDSAKLHAFLTEGVAFTKTVPPKKKTPRKKL